MKYKNVKISKYHPWQNISLIMFYYLRVVYSILNKKTENNNKYNFNLQREEFKTDYKIFP